MKKLIIFLLFLSAAGFGVGEAGATAYTRYVDTDAATGGDGSTAGTSGATCAFKTLSQVGTFISTTMTTSDSATIYFQKGDTFAISSQLSITKSNVTLDAYGTGNKPIIDGQATYPTTYTTAMIEIGNNANCTTGVYIQNLDLYRSAGCGILFKGTAGSAGGYYTGAGGVNNCIIRDYQWNAILMQR